MTNRVLKQLARATFDALLEQGLDPKAAAKIVVGRYPGIRDHRVIRRALYPESKAPAADVPFDTWDRSYRVVWDRDELYDQ